MPAVTLPSMEHALKRSILPKTKLAIITASEQGTQFCCVECAATYSDKTQLEVHLCSHFKEYRFLCGICGTGLKRKEHLDRHTLGHQEVRPHVCTECGKAFKRKEHLNIHRTIHTGDKNQVCPLCHRSFYRKDHLQKHLQTHTKMFMEQNIIPLSDQELMQIKGEVMDEDIKPVVGEEGEIACEVTMAVDEDRGTQQNGYIPKDPERPYECVVCQKTYKRKDHLKLHALTHIEKDKVCSECGKGFHKEEHLLSHMKVHLNQYQPQVEENGDLHVDNSLIDIMPLDSLLVPRVMPTASDCERKHACTVCGRRFKRKQHLAAHSNMHARQQPTIWCSLCNQGFYSNLQFESHQCPEADGGGGEGGSGSGSGAEGEAEGEGGAHTDAKKENNQHDGGFTPIPIVDCMPLEAAVDPLSSEAHLPAPQRVYVCKYCSKPFKRKDHYKIHLHIHTGVRSFFCPDCGKGFYRKDHLQKHSQVHSRSRAQGVTSQAQGATSQAQGVTSQGRKRNVPALFPLASLPALKHQRDVKPEITITAPSNTKLRVPLQIKVPYQVVVAGGGGGGGGGAGGADRTRTIHPHAY